MYRCSRCKEAFLKPYIQEEVDHYEYFGRPVNRYTYIDRCPACGSEDIYETNTCKACGGATEDPRKDFCNECHRVLAKELEAAQEALGVDFETLQDFIAEHFGW